MRCTTMLLGAVVIAGCATSHTPRLRTVAALEVRSPQTGVYVTADDFDAGRLADAIACESDARPVDRDAFRRTAVVVVPGANQARQYAKADIFGFRACDGTDVRFVRLLRETLP